MDTVYRWHEDIRSGDAHLTPEVDAQQKRVPAPADGGHPEDRTDKTLEHWN